MVVSSGVGVVVLVVVGVVVFIGAGVDLIGTGVVKDRSLYPLEFMVPSPFPPSLLPFSRPITLPLFHPVGVVGLGKFWTTLILEKNSHPVMVALVAALYMLQSQDPRISD